MRIAQRLAAISAVLLIGGTAEAINEATFSCQKTIEKAVEKFIDQVADPIEKCLLAVQKCNLDTNADPATCKAKLLEAGKGKCVAGKLASDTDYFGDNASQNHDPNSKAAIDKALGKFKSTLAACDLATVDFATLGLLVPADFNDFVNSLITVPEGAACLAHSRIERTLPNMEAVLLDLGDELGNENFPDSIVNAIFSADCR